MRSIFVFIRMNNSACPIAPDVVLPADLGSSTARRRRGVGAAFPDFRFREDDGSGPSTVRSAQAARLGARRPGNPPQAFDNMGFAPGFSERPQVSHREMLRESGPTLDTPDLRLGLNSPGKLSARP